MKTQYQSLKNKNQSYRDKNETYCLAYRQGCSFNRFKNCDDFLDMGKKFRVNISTINFLSFRV